MCRACDETPDGHGRRCTRSDGFSAVEGEQRNRSRGLNNAADALAHGDTESAVNQLENARRAQRTLDGVPSAPIADPQPAAGPQRDLIISPSSVDSAREQFEQINRRRADQGKPPLTVEITRQNAPDTADPIMTWERATVRISGADQEDLDSLSLNSVGNDPERRAKTSAVLEATCAVTRIDSEGQYVSRAEAGPDSTPARVTQYIHDAPGGPLRQRYAPTDADQVRAKSIRTWGRATQPTNDYLRSMRHALGEESLGPRDVGTAASALSGYERAYADKSRAEQLQAEFLAKHGGGPPAEQAQGAQDGGGRMGAAGVGPDGRPPRSLSRWLNNVGDKIMVQGRVERSIEVAHANRYDTTYMYLIRSRDGDVVKWVPVNFIGFQEGDSVTLRGEVRGHVEFQGEKQTEMFYCTPTLHD